MTTQFIKAHYDGQHIVLDEPIALRVNEPLLLTVMVATLEAERASWSDLGIENFGRAYGDNEPDYADAELLQS
jgi:hypothetical protein